MWTKEEIGLVIKNTRLTAGLTQSQVAKALGRPQQTIANWEVGRSQPDANTLFELFKLLGADLNTSFGFFPGRKSAPSYSGEALKLAADYDSLDDHGQRVIRVVADEELSRCAKEQARASTIQRTNQEAVEDSDPVIEVVYFAVPVQVHPPGAGGGQYADYEETETFHLTKEPPRGTSYIVRVSGDSMEPTYHDGDKLFVRACEEIEVGQIGVFLMDGQQWVKELGDGVLISHNDKYDPIPMREDIRCQGLVLGVCDESYFEK